MESTIESLAAAKEHFISAALAMVESRHISDQAGKAAALEAFKQKWELFSVACDQAEELVESVGQRIGYECLVDKATGSDSGAGGASGPGSQSVAPISALRLEQISKAVRLLVMDLLQGPCGGAHPHGPTNQV